MLFPLLYAYIEYYSNQDFLIYYSSTLIKKIKLDWIYFFTIYIIQIDKFYITFTSMTYMYSNFLSHMKYSIIKYEIYKSIKQKEFN